MIRRRRKDSGSTTPDWQAMLVQANSRPSGDRSIRHLNGNSRHRGLCGAPTNDLYKLAGLSLDHFTFEICDSCVAIAES